MGKSVKIKAKTKAKVEKKPHKMGHGDGTLLSTRWIAEVNKKKK